tara:strand:- start:751 stop:939 length:189 start_codon:yes stop_codon:yes gene_type:complete
MYYRPVELSKLCCNVIVKKFYHTNEEIFKKNILALDLPEYIFDLILDRYKLINIVISSGGCD